MSRELDGSPLAQSQRELEERDKKRLETFIDAVFAIAITLLGWGLFYRSSSIRAGHSWGRLWASPLSSRAIF